MFALLIPASVAMVVWVTGLVFIITTMIRVPTARAGVRLAGEGRRDERVLIVVPAHNEAGSIADLVRSLCAQRDVDFRVVLMLDRCTDNTRAVAEDAAAGDARVQILENHACPDDWAGKVHAVWSGLSRSGLREWATHLVFTDADTSFDPDCLRATLALMDARGLGMLSLLSTLSTGAWFERIVQPVAALELLRQYPLLKVNRATDRRPFANGQFMMFRTRVYDACGGHESVRGALLEDIALARAVERSGNRGGLLLANGMLRCRMYADDAEFRRGWKRIFTEAANQRADRLRRHATRVRLLGLFLPLSSAALLVSVLVLPMFGAGLGVGVVWASLLVGAIGLGAWCAAMGVSQWAGHGTWWVIPLLPFGAWRVGKILDEASDDLRQSRPTEWGGRVYARPDRSQVSAGSETDGLEGKP